MMFLKMKKGIKTEIIMKVKMSEMGIKKRMMKTRKIMRETMRRKKKNR